MCDGCFRFIYAADVVSLLTSTPGSAYCGIAWHMSSVSSGFAGFAYSVVEQSCAVGPLAFSHELGHNMGAHHDPFVAGAEQTLFPYSHGYVDLVARFRTIMSYTDQCAATQSRTERYALTSLSRVSRK